MKPRNHFEAVQAGTFDAVDGAIRNATSCPTADFFWAVKEGVREAVEKMILLNGDDALRALGEIAAKGEEK